MPRIKCHYIDCVFLDDSYCGAAAVEIDPDSGCLTYKQSSRLLDDNDWDDEDTFDEDWDEMGFDEEEDDDDDMWLDDDDDF